MVCEAIELEDPLLVVLELEGGIMGIELDDAIEPNEDVVLGVGIELDDGIGSVEDIRMSDFVGLDDAIELDTEKALDVTADFDGNEVEPTPRLLESILEVNEATNGLLIDEEVIMLPLVDPIAGH